MLGGVALAARGGSADVTLTLRSLARIFLLGAYFLGAQYVARAL